MAYRKLWQPEHPLSDMLGFVAQYKITMCEKLGRLLSKDEVVHHMDYDKTNDAPENLKLLTRQQHNELPVMQARFLIAKGLLEEFWSWWEVHHNDPPEPEKSLRVQLNTLLNEQEMRKRKLHKCGEVIEEINDNEQQ